MDIRTISGAAYSRPVASIAGGDASLPAEVAKSADSAAPFFSPVYRFDPVAKLSILSFRDANTGAVTQQIPNERIVEQYRRSGGETPGSKPAASTSAVTEKTSAPTAAETAQPAETATTTAATTTTASEPPPTAAPERAAAPAAAPVQAAPEVAAPQTSAPAPRVSLSV